MRKKQLTIAIHISIKGQEEDIRRRRKRKTKKKSTMSQPLDMAANISNHSSSGPAWSHSEKSLFTFGLVTLSVLTLFGNTLVVLAFYAHRPLRTYTNYFIISLSMSDIMVALISMPIWITFILSDMDANLLNGKLIQAWTCIDIMTGVASILNLTAVTVDRFIHVTQPLTHSKQITKQRVLKAIVVIWVIAFCIASIKGVFYRYWVENKPSYETLIVIVGFILPLSIIMFCYIRIYQVVQNQLQRFMEQSRTLQNETREKTDYKAIKTIAVVVLAFFLCWCPFFVLNLYNGWCRYYKGLHSMECRINNYLLTAAKWLHYTNSSLNPVIYACFNREFRNGFKIALYKRLSMQNNPNSAITSLIKRVSLRSMFYEPSPPAPFRQERTRRHTVASFTISTMQTNTMVTTQVQNGRNKTFISSKSVDDSNLHSMIKSL